MVKPGGVFVESKLRMKASAICVNVSALPRAVSQMTSMSFMNCAMLKNCVTVDHSLVFLLATRTTLAPQFGWHEQPTDPNVDGPVGPLSERMWSASHPKAPIAPSGYQSRCMSILPLVCLCKSCARFDVV